jgi:hypothetical protein
MRARGQSRHQPVRAALAAVLVAASAMAPLAAQTPLPPNLPRPTGPDRHHADKCALFVLAGRIGRGHLVTGSEADDRRLRAIIDRLQHEAHWDDMVLRCPHFTVPSAIQSAGRIGHRGLDGFGWSADGRYASIADNYLPNRLGGIGRECLFERVAHRWRYRGCVGTYGA